MMNRLLIAAVVLVLVLAMAAVGMACSSFVVYGANGAVFGMNFDIPHSTKRQRAVSGSLRSRETALPLSLVGISRCSTMIKISSSPKEESLAVSMQHTPILP